jgi:hypothetical protein
MLVLNAAIPAQTMTVGGLAVSAAFLSAKVLG